jgi:hypothetical protein
MQRLSLALGMALVLAVSIPASLLAQESGGGMTEEEAMAANMKYATPGPHHEHMKETVGRWNTTTRFWMAPGTEPAETEGTSEFTSIMGGRYVLEKFHGNMMGMPFEGMNLMGYDNFRQEHVSVWVDNMSTTMMFMHGSCDADKGEITMEGTYDDVMTGEKNKKMKGTVHLKGKDEFTYEMYMPGPDGEMFKSLEIVYTRQAEGGGD